MIETLTPEQNEMYAKKSETLVSECVKELTQLPWHMQVAAFKGIQSGIIDYRKSVIEESHIHIKETDNLITDLNNGNSAILNQLDAVVAKASY